MKFVGVRWGRMLVTLVIGIVCWVTVSQALQESALEQARLHRENLVRKYLKKLKKEEGAIKLVGGRGDFEGNVEIFHDGKWGSVCDDEWDSTEAEVVCRQLGYPGHVKATHSGQFGKAKRKFWMDNLFCGGKETELAHCHFDGWGHSDCEASESAGVICKDDDDTGSSTTAKPIPEKFKPKKFPLMKDLELRLAGGRIPNEGRVEVRIADSGTAWGTICADGWSLLEGNVVCRQLGLGYANDAIQTDFFGGSNRTEILLSGTECYGNETNLGDCLHHEVGWHSSCSERGTHVAAVTCVEKMADLAFDHVEMEQSLHLEDRLMYLLQCAMEENCVASQAYDIQRDNPNWHLESRRLMKFTARVLNTGTADFRPHIPKHLCQDVTAQWVSTDVRETPEFLKTINELIEERARQRFMEHWQRLQFNRNILQSSEPARPSFTYHKLPLDINQNPKSPIEFAVGPSDPRFYDIRDDSAYTKINFKDDDTLDQELMAANPNLPPPPQDIKPKLPINVNQQSWNEEQRFDESLLPQRVSGVHQRPVEMGGGLAMYIVALIGGISAAATVGLISIIIGWNTLHKKAKAAADVEYPAYGVTGPNKDSSPTSDRRLAQSAQMYHYQHQKQQIIAMQRNSNTDTNANHSDAESEDNNEEGDYTVYECPGLAPAGEMEVKNPLFLDDTPLSLAKFTGETQRH